MPCCRREVIRTVKSGVISFNSCFVTLCKNIFTMRLFARSQ